MIKYTTQQIKTRIVKRMVFVLILVFTVFSMTKATAQQIKLDEDRLTAIQTSMSITQI
ncbi:hypothetical protein [Sphingobacterium sp. UDSM-2020]|uniref:hypothetical protein n=1 Tax=Sphingobacterium sp. UDSM-2020 TaxID=2795738 RepID=UPI001E3FD4C5|nr:hypothetical protein [Sphingobacterium sp. UDSM-2020]